RDAAPPGGRTASWRLSRLYRGPRRPCLGNSLESCLADQPGRLCDLRLTSLASPRLFAHHQRIPRWAAGWRLRSGCRFCRLSSGAARRQALRPPFESDPVHTGVGPETMHACAYLAKFLGPVLLAARLTMRLDPAGFLGIAQRMMSDAG